jgi:transposase
VYFLYSNKLVNIPEIHVKDLSFDDDQGIVYFRIEPAQSVCETEWQIILLVPSINLKCKQCDAHFVWQFEFVEPKRLIAMRCKTNWFIRDTAPRIFLKAIGY